MNRYIIVVAVLFSTLLPLGHAGELKYAVIPTDGFVPDAETAKKIAEAVWIPIYGKKVIDGEKPFKTKLKDGVWTVEGTLPAGDLGGVALVEIAKSDGRILRVTHDQ